MTPARAMLACVLSVTFVLELRYAWVEWNAPPSRPLRPVNWSEDQEDLAPRPAGPLDALPLGGALTHEGLGIPLTQDQVTLPELLHATRSDDPMRVKLAVLGLRRLHDPAALPRVAELTEASLANQDLDGLKKQLVWTLGMLAPRAEAAKWLPLLEKFLSDTQEAVKDYAAFAMARLGDARGAELTRATMLDPAKKPITRGRAAIALADGGFTRHRPDIQQLLQGSPPCELSGRARRALETLSAPH